MSNHAQPDRGVVFGIGEECRALMDGWNVDFDERGRRARVTKRTLDLGLSARVSAQIARATISAMPVPKIASVIGTTSTCE